MTANTCSKISPIKITTPTSCNSLKISDSIYDQFIKEIDNFTIEYLFNNDHKNRLADIINRVVGHSSVNLIKASLSNNINLMLLHIKTIPDSIQRAIYAAIDRDWEGALKYYLLFYIQSLYIYIF